MKIILFIIVILIIYFVATQLKVVHIDALPAEQQNELNNRSKMKEMLLTNYIKAKKKTESSPNLLSIIKSTHLNPDYIFNAVNLPTTILDPNAHRYKYIQCIRDDIIGWNDHPLMEHNKTIKIGNIRPTFVMQADSEFIIRANCLLYYDSHNWYFELSYYGKIERSDDPFYGDNDQCVLQLIDIRPITKRNYELKIKKTSQFMDMEEQMQYVDKINRMHQDEIN